MAETREQKIKRLEKSTKKRSKRLADDKFSRGDVDVTPKKKSKREVLFPSKKMVTKKPQKAMVTTPMLDTTNFDRRKNIKKKRHSI